MNNLKQARKEGREYLNKNRWHSYCYISYRREFGFYHVEAFETGRYKWDNRDGYEVFKLNKDGTLEKVANTEHSKKFHTELKRRKERRK